ncbi:MAG: glycosyltransferase family 2 protein [Leptolyngbya sp. SIO1D8]|nr:glycosyltransferase family 2 protein [Leptolyngbya sp. SIO1D8]
MFFNKSIDKQRRLSQITIVIKTFQRPATITGALKTIRRFYPEVRLLVADDSREPLELKDSSIELFTLPFDTGVSAGRNFLLEKVETPYFLMMDDDHFFNGRTNLLKLLDILEKYDFDVLSALVFQRSPFKRDLYRKQLVDFYLNMELVDGTLKFVDGHYEKTKEYTTCDLVHQFFLAKTAPIKAIGGWDDQLKTADHADFFIRAKEANLKVGYTPQVRVDHVHIKEERFSQDYAPFRKRMSEFRRIWVEKHNIHTIVQRDGRTFSAQQFIAQKGW